MLESWCWGAGGVGLALTRQRGARGNRRPPLGLDLALGQVLAHPVRTDDSLCHGTMADVELLLESARAYGDANLRAEAERRAMTVIGHDGLVWRSSASVDEETPGLMTGLSGIGYGLLRVVAPEHVPSILLLDTGRKVSVRSAA
jgi:lantibiotic modifying enzyme